MIKWITILIIVSMSLASKTPDELVNTIANKDMKIKYYFFIQEKKAFLSSKKNDGTYAIWHFTNDRKWQPIHNTKAYDGFNEAKKSFQSVSLDLDNANMTFSSLESSDNTDIDSLLKILENKTIQIKWYFWLVAKDAFLFTKDGQVDVRIWYFTNERKWQPIHNADAYDGYPKADKTLGDITFNHADGTLSVGHTMSNDDILNINFSHIPYLKTNHNNYSQHGGSENPRPTKDSSAKSIKWSIDAKTVEDAITLHEHIAFMEDNLKKDKNPKAYDSLFLMEGYMKYNKKYTTLMKRVNNNLTITKIAKDSCAYDVISAHSDVVSGDFFAQGITNIDHTSTADTILASSSCDLYRESITKYILDRKVSKGNGNSHGNSNGKQQGKGRR